VQYNFVVNLMIDVYYSTFDPKKYTGSSVFNSLV
jgi:hypothetical protein